jgi:hypothetical protein
MQEVYPGVNEGLPTAADFPSLFPFLGGLQ